MKLPALALAAFTLACASAATEAPAPVAAAQTQTADVGLSLYEGTYSLEGPNRVLDLRVWRDPDGKLHGELVGLGRQTVFRPSDTAHKFLHETRDDVWFLFTIENGRATAATMHQAGREITGPRTK